eukprot:EST43041.1 hypothetical protein SS50377_17343 [Spironucleus salmonicida]
MIECETSDSCYSQVNSTCKQLLLSNFQEKQIQYVSQIAQSMIAFTQTVKTILFNEENKHCYKHFTEYIEIEQLLANNNQLKKTKFVESCQFLQFVDLSFNELTKVQFKSDSLLQLNLSYNRIRSIDISFFPKLKILVATNNEIVKFYGSNSELLYLNLSNNKLQNFSDKYLQHILFLNLSANTLQNIKLYNEYDYLQLSNNPIKYIEKLSSKSLLVNQTMIQFWNYCSFSNIQYLETDLEYPIMFLQLFEKLDFLNGIKITNMKNQSQVYSYVKFARCVAQTALRLKIIPVFVDIGRKIAEFKSLRAQELMLMLQLQNL